MTVPIIHDCDPGNDDALAILVAAGHAGLDLKAVTTGAGHLAHDRTARNAAITLAVAGRPHVPVAAGAEGPLVRERLIAGILDLESGLDPERPDLYAVDRDGRHSADVIADGVLGGQVTTIVTTGPLTNLALALRHHPLLAGRIGRIISLAGAWGLGNKTASAEWNILCDPEAAAIVLSSKIPLTLIPVDAAAQVGITPALIERIGAIAGPVGQFARELLASLAGTFRPGLFVPPHMPLNDPIAVLVAADPSLAQLVPARVDIELAGRFTYGRTVIDFANRSGLPTNADVAVALDAARLHEAFIRAIGRLAEANPIGKEK